MIYLIDNYDSFSYNVYQLFGSIRGDITVIRNDAMSVDELEAAHPSALILSPGPGRPADAGICEQAVLRFDGRIPILGICLGHQAICEALGATVTYAAEIMHGKGSSVELAADSTLFKGVASPTVVGRYHSLEVDPITLPATLRVTAQTDTGEVMAVEHTERPTFGLQFHPESILTPEGRTMAENFMALAGS